MKARPGIGQGEEEGGKAKKRSLKHNTRKKVQTRRLKKLKKREAKRKMGKRKATFKKLSCSKGFQRKPSGELPWNTGKSHRGGAQGEKSVAGGTRKVPTQTGRSTFPLDVPGLLDKKGEKKGFRKSRGGDGNGFKPPNLSRAIGRNTLRKI